MGFFFLILGWGFRVHYENSQIPDGFRFQCPSCDCNYSREDTLKAHIKKLHNDCHLPIGKKEIILPSETTLSPPKPKKDKIVHDCGTCGKSFPEKQALQKHTAKIHKVKYECNVCNFKMAGKEKLDRHNAKFHNDGKGHKCPVCEKHFLFKNKLVDHVKVLHKSVLNPYKCNYCAKSFASLLHFERHVGSVHEGKNPYVCRLCRPSTKVCVE